MATSFLAVQCKRPMSVDMFTDLGFPVITYTPIVEPLGYNQYMRGYQIDLVQNLTAAQIRRARMRLGTWTTTDEDTLVAAVGALTSLDTYIALPAPSAVEQTAMIKTLAIDVRALINWVCKDILA